MDGPQYIPLTVPDNFPGDAAPQQGILMGLSVYGLLGAKAVFVVLIADI